MLTIPVSTVATAITNLHSIHMRILHPQEPLQVRHHPMATAPEFPTVGAAVARDPDLALVVHCAVRAQGVPHLLTGVALPLHLVDLPTLLLYVAYTIYLISRNSNAH